MRKNILLGFSLANGCFLSVCVMAMGGISRLYDLEGIVIVIGGTVSSLIYSVEFRELRKFLKHFWKGLRTAPYPDARKQAVQQVVALARAYRKGEGAFQTAIQSTENRFLKQAASRLSWVHLEVSTQDIRELLEAQCLASYEEMMTVPKILRFLTKYPPAYGMMGTIVGLCAMFNRMGDPNAKNTLGPAMGVALMTTLYGIMVNNLFLAPIAENLTTDAKEDFATNSLMVEGLMLILAKQPTKYIEEKLLAHLGEEMGGMHHEVSGKVA